MSFFVVFLPLCMCQHKLTEWLCVFLCRYVNGKTYMEDVANALEEAKEEIFITDWWWVLVYECVIAIRTDVRDPETSSSVGDNLSCCLNTNFQCGLNLYLSSFEWTVSWSKFKLVWSSQRLRSRPWCPEEGPFWDPSNPSCPRQKSDRKFKLKKTQKKNYTIK